MKKDKNGEIVEFSDCAIGRSESEAIYNAYKWEARKRYKISKPKLVKKPSWLHFINPFISPYYVVSFTVTYLKHES